MMRSEAARWKLGSEMESLRSHKVYDLVLITSMPPVQKVVSSRWVRKIKQTTHARGAWSCRYRGK